MLKPFPNNKFYSSKLKEIEDDNFSFDENGRKLFKLAGNTMGKGKIASYTQFLLFPRVFKKLVLQTPKTRACLGTG